MRVITRHLTTIIAMIALIAPHAAAQPAADAASSVMHLDATRYVATIAAAPREPHARSLSVDAARLRDALGRHGRALLERFPIDVLDDASVVLETHRGVVDARTVVRVGSERGEIAGALPAVATYRGRIVDEPRSRLFIVCAGERLFGFVERESGERWVIGPDTRVDGGAHVLARESSLPSQARELMSSCRAERTEGYHRAGRFAPRPRLLGRELLEFAIAVEADQEFYRRTGGTVEGAVGYIVALWSMVSTMYEDEIDVTLRLPWIKVWQTQDPYQVAGNGYALWGKAPAYWREHYDTVERDLAHIFTASDWGGGGIAFRGEGVDDGPPALCSKERGYAMSSPRAVLTYPTFAFTYDAYIVAHETGHNFGARHTHDCWWNPAIDTCLTRDDAQFRADDACHAMPVTPRPSSGSIMSYCMSINQKAGGGSFEAWSVALVFTPRVAAMMRLEAENVACRRAPTRPTIVLTNPRGRVSPIFADTTLLVTWNAFGVSSYRVEYSSDDRVSWRTIASDLPADTRALSWRTPEICSERLWLRVSDASDASVADTSLLPIRINAPDYRPVVELHGDTLVAPEGRDYLWRRDGEVIAGETSRTLVATEPGLYTVFMTGENGCLGESDAVAVRMSGVERDDATTEIALVADAIDGCCRVRFRLDRTEHVSLRLFDAAGRCVATLVDEQREPGTHVASWSRGDGSAGLYWVVLRVGSRTIIERMPVR